MLSKYLVVVLILGLLIVSAGDFALAQNEANDSALLAPGTLTNNSGLPGEQGETDLLNFVSTIIQWAAALMGVILLVMFVYGGLTLALSVGNKDRADAGKRTIFYAIIGVGIVAAAYVLSDYILSALFATSVGR